jgi:hypothetical protein
MASKRTLSLRWALAALLLISSASFALTPPPPAPLLLTPKKDTINQDTGGVVFKWDSAQYAVSYSLDVSRDTVTWISLTGFPRSHNVNGHDTMDANGANGFVYSTKYFWRVQAASVDSIGKWSAIFNFTTTIKTPAATVLTSPHDKDTGLLVSTTLKWSTSPGATSYGVQVSIDPHFGSFVVNDSASHLPDTTRSLSIYLIAGRTYYWRVNAKNSAGTSPWTMVLRFSTQGEDYTPWPHSQKLHINTSTLVGGAGIRNKVYNFPVLVRLNPKTFGWFSQTSVQGTDIRFSKSDAQKTPLHYEIERWVDVSGDLDTAEIWVRLDTVNALDSSQYIVMYWGNGTAPNLSDPYGTFDTAGAFYAVWHMNEAPSGPGSIKDRTLTGCNGTPVNAPAADTGTIGRALTFSGGSGGPYVQLDTLDSLTGNLSGGMTMSAWVKWTDSTPVNHCIAELTQNGTAANRVSFGNSGASGSGASSLDALVGLDSLKSAGGYIQLNAPMLVSAVYHHGSVDTLTIYRNGSVFNASTLPGPAFAAPLYKRRANFIARNWISGTGLFKGTIDELEISRTARDSNWIRLAYQTQRTDQSALCYPPSIAQSPHDTTVPWLGTAQFTVVARGNNLLYQWKRSNNGGGLWDTAPGPRTSATYSFTTSATDTSGANPPKFRCFVSTLYSTDTVTSAAATLTVCVPTVISAGGDPVSTSVFVGDVSDTARFSVYATGRNPTYLWQRSNNGGTNWSTASGTATNITYKYVAPWTDTNSAYSSIQFRCIVTSGMSGICAGSVTSAAATLSLCYHVTISQQPRDTGNGVTPNPVDSTSAHFSVAASAGKIGVSYQWYNQKLPDTTWYPITAANATTYTIPQVLRSDSGTQFRCKISTSSCGFLFSNAAWLRVCTRPSIPNDTLHQPQNTNVTIGDTATFKCKSSAGTGISYQWQQSTDTGKSWSTIVPPATDTIYKFQTTTSNTGFNVEYRCMVTGTCGSVISNPARVGSCFPDSIVAPFLPANTWAYDSMTATFSVNATGSGLSYQWQTLAKGADTTQWTNAADAVNGAYSPSYHFFVSSALLDSGMNFRCIVIGDTTKCGKRIASSASMLRVWTRVRFVTPGYPSDTTVPDGTPAIFRVSISGNGSSSPTFEWQISHGDTNNYIPINAATPIAGHKSGYNTSMLTLSQTDTLDTNAYFRCAVTGYYGTLPLSPITIHSRGARLSLCYTPTFDSSGKTFQNPAGTVSPGLTPVVFSVLPKVVGTASYQWQLDPGSGTFSSIPGANLSSLTITPVLSSYSGYKYRCNVWSGSCGNGKTSNSATLIVCAPPSIPGQPQNQSVIEGATAVFSDSAIGTNVTYWWQRRKGAQTDWTIDTVLNRTSPLLQLSSVTMADDSSFFRCINNGSCGAVTSDSVILHVYQKAHAVFGISNSQFGPWSRFMSGPGPVTMYFNDSSKGYINQGILHFGDGTDTVFSYPPPWYNAANPLPHNYPNVTQLTTYLCTLAVSGVLGNTDTMINTIVVYPAGATINPILISGRYLGPDSVELALSNYMGLRDMGVSPFVDTLTPGIRIWSQAKRIPADTTSGASIFKSYYLKTLMAAGGYYYLDTIVGPDTSYGFMTQIKWDDSSKTYPFDSGNGCYVIMRDTTHPQNNFQLSGGYVNNAPWDTAYLSLFTNPYTPVNPAPLDSVAQWYGIGTDTVPDFARSNPHVKWWSINTIYPIVNGGGTFTDTVINNAFNTETIMLHYAVAVLGKNKLLSPIVPYYFQIGRPRPNNPIVLHAAADSSGSSIHLTWTWDSITSGVLRSAVDSVRIYYRSGSTMPDTFQFDTTLFKRVRPDPAVNASDIWVNGLNGNTMYYFGAQIFSNNGLWSLVTGGSSASDSTPDPWLHGIRNTFKIDTALFDTATDKMVISWHVDRMGYSSGLYRGITFFPQPNDTPQGTPVPKDTILARFKAADFTGIPVSQRTITSDSGTDSIDLDQLNLLYPGTLRFDTTYYVFLWLDKTGQPWSVPTDSSAAVFRLPPFVWQTTQLNFSSTGDTSYWAGGQVRYTIPPTKSAYVISKKIHLYKPDSASLGGFIPAGHSIVFMDKNSTDSFNVGFNVAPGPYFWQEARIYRYNTATGMWDVRRDMTFDVSYISVKIDPNSPDSLMNFSTPLAVMVDIDTPKVTWRDSADGTVPKKQLTPVTDSLYVSDNVGNLRWRYYSARGEDSIHLDSSKILTNGKDTVNTAIDSSLVSDLSGARAEFVADDGRYNDTVNMSRRVYRDTNSPSEKLSTVDMKWVPLRVTADLDSPSAKRLWKFVADANGTYDNRYVRLFRFYPDSANASAAVNQKWVEFNERPDSVFDFIPGRLFWVKTRTGTSFNFGRGITLPLNKDDTIILNPQSWTDFALPFQFDIRIGDIINATFNGAPDWHVLPEINNLQFYQWIATNNSYQDPTQFYIPSQSIGDSFNIASSSANTGFTVFNPSNDVLILHIPPIPITISSLSHPSPAVTPAAKLTAKQTAKKSAGGWMARLLPKTDMGAVLTPVYCGYDASGAADLVPYPMPPSFGKLSVGISEEQTGALYAIRVLHRMKDGGCCYLVTFINDTTTARTISFTLERRSGFTGKIRTVLYDQSTGATVDLTGAKAAAVMVDGQTNEYRWLLVGDDNYIAYARKSMLPVLKLALARIYPNPARSLVRLRYTIPFSMDKVEFTVFDISGRTIWSKTMEEHSPFGGSRECQWSVTTSAGRRVAAGVYIVRMAAFNQKGKMVGTFNQLLTVLH